MAVSRAKLLPKGISVEKTPTGEKFKLRLSSRKLLRELGLEKPVYEVFDNFKDANNRLLDYVYRKDKVQKEINEKIAFLSRITMRDVLTEAYKHHYSKLAEGRTHKSRLNIIINTELPANTSKIVKLAGQSVNLNSIYKDKMIFGDVSVEDYEEYLFDFIAARQSLGIKNQTIKNDLMMISKSLKNAHHYFTNRTPIERPLKSIDFKTLKDQKTGVSKKLTDKQVYEIIEICVKHSRSSHYTNLIIFLFATGLRISEARKIMVKDIDFEEQIIFIVSSKNQKIRYVPIVPDLVRYLKELINDKKATEKIFPLTMSAYQTKIKHLSKYLAEQGLKYSYHLSRHYYASKMLQNKSNSEVMHNLGLNDYGNFQKRYEEQYLNEAVAKDIANGRTGFNLSDVKRLLGHNSPQITHESYSHQEPKIQAEQDKSSDIEELKRIIATQNEMINKLLGSIKP